MIQDLSVTRGRIDEVDRQIVKLFEQRMELALDVARYKEANGKPVYDRQREQEKLETLSSLAGSEENAMGIRELFSQIMAISRRHQYSVLGEKSGSFDSLLEEVDRLQFTDSTVAVYAGVPGAFAEEALSAYFGDVVQTKAAKDFAEAAGLVADGEADFAVLPLENSSAGFVNGIYDLLAGHGLTIVGEQKIRVDQCLLGLPGTQLDKVRTVYSHPQGLLQAKEYLEDKGWRQVGMSNTALAARKVHEDGDLTQTAVASARAARLYGLEILNPRLNQSSHNATRFVIVTGRHIYERAANRISISFSVPHACGTLYNVLSHFIYNGINLTSIESVPLSGKQWEYSFFVEMEGNPGDSGVRNAMKGIMAETEDFRILGCFVSKQ